MSDRGGRPSTTASAAPLRAERSALPPRTLGGAGVAIVLAATLAAAGVAPPAQAEPVKCQRAVLKESDTLAQTVAKTLRKCEELKRRGKLAPATDCVAEPAAAGKIAKAESTLAAKIAKQCGGRDKTCGTADDDTPFDIGWPVACPDFEGRGCIHAIGDCADVAECVRCVQRVAVEQTVGLAYAALVPVDKRAEKKLYKCQSAIGTELLKFRGKHAKALGRCWDRGLKGKHANACPDPGDGKALGAVAKARSTLAAKLCKQCGGADKACGGGDDFAPSAIGFPSACPAVGGCAGPVTSLAALVDCVGCVADFKVECALALSVPALADYPPACVLTLPTPTPTPTVVSSPSTTAIVVATVTPTAITATPTPTPTAAACAVGAPGTVTTTVTISLTTAEPVGAATVLLAYPIERVGLPAAGGGAAVRARITDLTGGEIFDKGSPNNQDSAADLVPDRVRFSVVSTTGVQGAVLAVEFDRCDGAVLSQAGDYDCTLANVVAPDGVTSIAGVACALGIAHLP